ncbi:MAG: formate--tetrahydrofolate ligase [Bacilli bacterium]
MLTDIEIAHQYKMLPIKEVSEKLNIPVSSVSYYGDYKAKLKLEAIEGDKQGKLILVTAISPTPYGEGKTTVTIGLGDALRKIEKNSVIVLREPSLGPVFGLKGGATGGGYSQVVPMEDINLHFTGDFHAITAANNLLCAAIDNHLYFGNSLGIDPSTISFSRCMDVNDRSLRTVRIGLSSEKETTREENFNITAASEIMTIFCLAKDIEDLRTRLDNIFIGYTYDKKPVYAKDFNISGSMIALLHDAIMPNLVQTLEGNPVLIHGGPFANIAHGCNSLIATKLGLSLADYVVTEAGFGSDLGAEKFLDIKCRVGNLKPAVIVIVATIKALKYNALVQKEDIRLENIEAVKRGLPNLEVHCSNMAKFQVPRIICLNRYDTDTDEEVEVVRNYCLEKGINFAVSTAYKEGGLGAVNLAKQVVELADKENNFKFLYDINTDIQTKIDILAHEIYHARDVIYSDIAISKINRLKDIGHNYLPICVAKTQYSISDDPKMLGSPENYTIHVADVRLYSGAGFITILLGNIMTMPGLPKEPNYEKIDYVNNEIIGLF